RLSDIRDSMIINGQGVPPHLRIPLNSAFINRIKAEADKDASALDTYPAFLGFLKGVYIEPDTNNGRYMPYFRIDGSTDYTRANLLFYYTNDSVQTQSFYFTSTYNAHYNRIRRDFSGTPIGSLVASPLES